MTQIPDDLGSRLALGGRHLRIPYSHVEFDPGSIVSTSEVDRLLSTFPGHLMSGARGSRRGGDKSYYVDHLPMFDRGRWQVDLGELAPPWQRLLSLLTSSHYADAIRTLLDIKNTMMDIEVRLSSYPAAGWMSRHTDRPDKVFSHNIYLCPGWKVEWGGGLALYRNSSDGEPSRVVLPAAGNSVAFARTDHSWHEVVAVASQTIQPRRAVLIHGYHCGGTAVTDSSNAATMGRTTE
jgi:2OG-Fe(II) oxygenase superfamily